MFPTGVEINRPKLSAILWFCLKNSILKGGKDILLPCFTLSMFNFGASGKSSCLFRIIPLVNSEAKIGGLPSLAMR